MDILEFEILDGSELGIGAREALAGSTGEEPRRGEESMRGEAPMHGEAPMRDEERRRGEEQRRAPCVAPHGKQGDR